MDWIINEWLTWGIKKMVRGECRRLSLLYIPSARSTRARAITWKTWWFPNVMSRVATHVVPHCEMYDDIASGVRGVLLYDVILNEGIYLVFRTNTDWPASWRGILVRHHSQNARLEVVLYLVSRKLQKCRVRVLTTQTLVGQTHNPDDLPLLHYNYYCYYYFYYCKRINRTWITKDGDAKGRSVIFFRRSAVFVPARYKLHV